MGESFCPAGIKRLLREEEDGWSPTLISFAASGNCPYFIHSIPSGHPSARVGHLSFASPSLRNNRLFEKGSTLAGQNPRRQLADWNSMASGK
ncbi:hypothetical protein AVEN_118734-1 [Araneus ventricosus]|uniref:Uncharacterized protein n=1 Tax=Araneus ventricosus TaxID=182803 RepID=A0A4Y2BYH0_ARAVE|nr:hypothetical protein AVEN_118734-1 [Araneus ventricosus]